MRSLSNLYFFAIIVTIYVHACIRIMADLCHSILFHFFFAFSGQKRNDKIIWGYVYLVSSFPFKFESAVRFLLKFLRRPERYTCTSRQTAYIEAFVDCCLEDFTSLLQSFSHIAT